MANLLKVTPSDLERGKRANANLNSTIKLLFLICTLYIDKCLNPLHIITTFCDEYYFRNTVVRRHLH